ncbi:unnamed protein product [Arctogadus glacialis]
MRCCERYNVDTRSSNLSKHDFLGQMFCTLGEIIGSTGSRLEKTLSLDRRSVLEVRQAVSVSSVLRAQELCLCELCPEASPSISQHHPAPPSTLQHHPPETPSTARNDQLPRHQEDYQIQMSQTMPPTTPQGEGVPLTLLKAKLLHEVTSE